MIASADSELKSQIALVHRSYRWSKSTCRANEEGA